MSKSAPSTSATPNPVLNVTRYDRASALLMAIVVGLIASVIWLGVVWATNRLPVPARPVPVELVELPGGVEDGSIEETLWLDSPEDVSSDPSLAEMESEVTEIAEMLDSVVELSDEAVNLAEKQFETQTTNTGRPGSATGTGRRALGMGPGEAGISREQRWFISFSERATVSEYARQLDAFGIELGALLRSGQLLYLSRLSSPAPQRRTAQSGNGESRLYMTWQGGERRKADFQLLEQQGVAAGDVLVIFHFYPPETEADLARLELNYAQRNVEQIRRTYFVVKPDGDGYKFEVTRQAYFRPGGNN